MIPFDKFRVKSFLMENMVDLHRNAFHLSNSFFLVLNLLLNWYGRGFLYVIKKMWYEFIARQVLGWAFEQPVPRSIPTDICHCQ